MILRLERNRKTRVKIVYSKQAVKTLARMDANTKQRIKQGVGGIPKGDIKKRKAIQSFTGCALVTGA